MYRRKLLFSFLALCFIKNGIATTGGLTSAGAFGLGGQEDTGLREMVELTVVGGLLVGRPEKSMIRLITVSAAKPHVSGRIILRELIAASGSRTLAITLPDSLNKDVRRINIFINSTSNLRSMKRYGVDQSAIIESFLLKVDRVNVHAGTETLIGFSIDKSGVFEIYDSDQGEDYLETDTLTEPSARNLIGGSYYHGFLPWIAAALLMLFSWGASRWTHRATQREIS